jgi:hypothetical protein
MKHLLLSLAFLLTANTAQAASSGHSHEHKSKYAGEDNRAVKSLSAKDIAELKRGAGWGLAKAAELNGVPGPAHLLELAERIPLNPLQVEKITLLFQDMKRQAMEKGERLIVLEQNLENLFVAGTINKKTLRTALEEIGRTRSELRYIHLATHLATPDILSRQQIEKYNHLRGYKIRAD